MKRKGSPETKRTGGACIFLPALLQLLARFCGWGIPSTAWGCSERRGTGRSSVTQLWGAGGLCQRRVQPMEFLWSCGGSREGQNCCRHSRGRAVPRAVPAQELQRKAVLNTFPVFDLDWRGKAIFSLSFLSPLNWDFYSLLGEIKNLFFVFYPERLFRKKERLLKYLRRFC